MRRLRPAMVAALLAACAGGPGTREDGPAPPDEAALAIETLVQAQKASFRISGRWRKELKFEGISVERPAPDRIEAKGSAVMVLRKLRVEASESIEIVFMADEHSDLLLYATDVKLFVQNKGFAHKTENVSAITLANDQVGYFQQ